MRKVVLLFVIMCALAFAANAQVTASPFEGRWVWSGGGEGTSEIAEMVFFGNILLVMEPLFPYYIGLPFTHAGGIISTENRDFEWQYRLSGNTLNITNQDGISASFTRAQTQRGHLDGRWKVIEGADHDPDEEQYVLFTSDIMAIGDNHEYIGFTIEFEGRAFRPSLSSLGGEIDFIPEELLEEFLASLLMEYNLSGNYLTLTHQGDELILRRIH